MKIITSFKRKEIKYILTAEKYDQLCKRIHGKYMQTDKYGLTTICNLYFDTTDYQLIRTSIEKPKYKEKLRLRSYGTPNSDTMVFLEIKKKVQGVVYKRRISLSLAEAEDYIENGVKPKNQGQIFNEIDYFINRYKAFPRVYLAYDRIAMYGIENKSFRITFDFNIRSRTDNLRLEYGDSGQILSDSIIMEIKTVGSMPMWMTKILSELEIYPASYSKYGNVYKNMILNGELTYV